MRGKLLRVGVIQDDPAAKKLCESVGKSLGARIEEIHAPAHVLVAGLETFELDVVYGRLEESSPLLSGVGKSQPYQKVAYEVAGNGAAPTSRELASDGVRAEDSSAALHAAHLGLKLNAESPWRFLPPGQAAPAGFVARQEGDPVAFVLALPPGENRWIMTIDEAIVAARGSHE